MKPQVTKHGRLIRPVSESARIDIAKVISDFQASDEQGMSQIYLNGACLANSGLTVTCIPFNLHRTRVSS